MNTHQELAKLDTASPAGLPIKASEELAIDRLLWTMDGSGERGQELIEFLERRDDLAVPAKWLDQWRRGHVPATREELLCLLERDITRIDDLLNHQSTRCCTIRLISGLRPWRRAAGVDRPRGCSGECKGQGLLGDLGRAVRDLERSIEFDQSVLFRKVYSDEFDTPGGEPFTVLVGDYELHLRPEPEHPTDDVEASASLSKSLLRPSHLSLSAPIPRCSVLTSLESWNGSMELEQHFEHIDYLKWRRLRETEDARFLVLTVPRVLRREPHDLEATGDCEFPYREETLASASGRYLWGAGGVRLRRSFGAGLPPPWMARGRLGPNETVREVGSSQACQRLPFIAIRDESPHAARPI